MTPQVRLFVCSGISDTFETYSTQHIYGAECHLVMVFQVVQSAPQMFQLSTEHTLTPRLAFLRDELGLSPEALAKVLVK